MVGSRQDRTSTFETEAACPSANTVGSAINTVQHSWACNSGGISPFVRLQESCFVAHLSNLPGLHGWRPVNCPGLNNQTTHFLPQQKNRRGAPARPRPHSNLKESTVGAARDPALLYHPCPPSFFPCRLFSPPIHQGTGIIPPATKLPPLRAESCAWPDWRPREYYSSEALPKSPKASDWLSFPGTGPMTAVPIPLFS